jgi:hypothetical protein
MELKDLRCGSHSGILSNCKELNLVENADDLVVLDVVLEVPAQECVLSIRTKTEAAFITAILNLATSSDDCCKKKCDETVATMVRIIATMNYAERILSDNKSGK